MIPLSKWWKIPYYRTGVKLYDFIAGSEDMKNPYYITRKKALDAFPMLERSGPVGALVYYGTVPAILTIRGLGIANV
jgi:glycerol-3-phosphate dehydrogenase